MAKNHKKKSEMLDSELDLDFNLDSGGFEDFDFSEPKDDRKPLTKIKDSFLEGMKDGVKESSFIKKTLKEMLPRGYGQTIDFASETSDKVSNMVDQTMRELKPGLKELKRAAIKSIPADSKYVPTKVGDLLKRWKTEQEDTDNMNRGASESEQRESMLSIQMADIFKAQMADKASERREGETKEALRHGLDAMRHRDSLTVQSDIAASVSRLDQYNRKINLGFQKKSLELSYRQLFAMQDMTKLMEKQTQILGDVLPAIQKNTGLPDYVKQTSAEFLLEFNKRRIAESAGRHLFGTTAEYLDKTFKTIGTKVKTSLKSGLDTTVDAVTQLQDAAEMMETTGMSFQEAIAGMAGDAASKKLVTAMAEKLGANFFKKNKSIGRIGLKAARHVANAGEHLEEFRSKNSNNYEPGVINWFKRQIAESMPGQGGGRSVSGMGESNELGKSALYTSRTDKTINDVIPGYLSRILRELQVFRTGNDKIELTHFDAAKSTFVSKTDMTKLAESRVYDKYSVSDLNTGLTDIFSSIETVTGIKLSEPAKKALRTRLAKNAVAGKHANEEHLGSAGMYEHKEGSEEAAALMRLFLGKASTQDKTLFESRHRGLRSSIANTHPQIQALIDQGHGNLLKEMGVLDQTGETVDTGKMLDRYLELSPDAKREDNAPQGPSFFDAVKGDASLNKMADSVKNQFGRGKEKSKKAKKWAAQQAAKFAKKAGAKGAAAAFGDTPETAKMGDVLKAAFSDIKGSSAGAAAAGKLDQINKEIDKLAAGNVHVQDAIDKAKAAGEFVTGAFTSVKTQTKSLLERCTVDGEIDFEVMAVELAKYPPAIRKKILHLISQLKEFGGNLKKEFLDEKGKVKAKTAPTEVPVAEAGKPGEEPEVKQFAKGGLFSGKILRGPVDFMLNTAKGMRRAVAGEDGSEAVLPVSDGGVQLLGKDGKAMGLLQLARDKLGRLSVTTDIKKKAQQASDYVTSKMGQSNSLKDTMLQSGSEHKEQTVLERVHDTLKQMLDRLDTIAATGMGYAPSPGLLRANASWLGKKFVSLTTMSAKAGMYLGGKSMQLGGAISSIPLKGIGGVFDIAKDAAFGVKDVYVEGEEKPRLYASAIKLGKYKRQVTKDILTTHKDVDQPIEDEAGNIIIKGEELDKLVCRRRQGGFEKLVRGAGSLFGKGLGLAGKGLKSAFGLSVKAFNVEMAIIKGIGKLGGKIIKAGYDHFGRPVDLFTPGVKEAVMLASLMKEDFYFSKVSGKIIRRYEDIDGPVMGKDGNEAVTMDMLKAGLFDRHGQPIKGRFAKLLGLGASALRLGEHVLGGLSKAAWGASKSLFNGGIGLLKGAGRLLTGGLSGMFGGGSNLGGGDRTIELLEEIRDILKDNATGGGSDDPDAPPTSTPGKSSGSWKDLARNAGKRALSWKKKIKDSATSAADLLRKKGAKAASAVEEGGGILEVLKKLVDMAAGARGLLTGASLMGLGTAATTAVAGGAAATGAAAAGTAAVAGGAAAATGAAAGGGMLAAAGGALLTLGGALAAFITAPITLGILAAAATGYGIWKGVQYFRNKLTPLDKLRLVQYGFHPDDTDAYVRVLKFERLLQDRVVFAKNGVDILEDKIPLKDIFGIFELDPDNREDSMLLTGWYRNRFKPVFLTHVLALKGLGKKVDFDAIAGLKNEEVSQYLQMASYAEGPYSYSQIPKKVKDYAVTTAADVQSVIQTVKDEMKLGKSYTPIKPLDDAKPNDKLQPGADQSPIPAPPASFTPKPTGPLSSADTEAAPTASAVRSPIDSKSNPQGLRMADGPLLDGRNGYSLIKQNGKLKLAEVNPALLKQFFGAVEEYYQLTGKRLTVTDGYRSYEEQVALKAKLGARAATPGHSLHGYGLALDADSKGLDEMDSLGLLRKYGLTRPVGGEPWHVEPAGIQMNIDAYKRNPDMAAKVIVEGIGRGGGGYGTVKSAIDDHRDETLAKNILQASVSPNVQTKNVNTDKATAPVATMMAAVATPGSNGPVSAMGPLTTGVQYQPVGGVDAESKPATAATPGENKASFGSLPTAAGISSSTSTTASLAKAPVASTATRSKQTYIQTSMEGSSAFNHVASPASAFSFNPAEIAKSATQANDNSAGSSFMKPTEALLSKSMETLDDIKGVLLQIYKAINTVKSESDKPKSSTADTSRTAQAAANETVGARSEMFKLPQLPVPMRRGI